MLCMCVSPFGCQATTVDNVPQRDQGFLCVTLCLLCARHAPVGSGRGGGLKVSGLSPHGLEINQITFGCGLAHWLAV